MGDDRSITLTPDTRGAAELRLGRRRRRRQKEDIPIIIPNLTVCGGIFRGSRGVIFLADLAALTP